MKLRREILSATCRTFCQVLGGDVVEPLNFLHDQLLLVDLDHERCISFMPSEPELADRVLQFLGDVYGVGLGWVRKRKTGAKWKSERRRTNHGSPGTSGKEAISRG